jgi:hypothetical protein
VTSLYDVLYESVSDRLTEQSGEVVTADQVRDVLDGRSGVPGDFLWHAWDMTVYELSERAAKALQEVSES